MWTWPRWLSAAEAMHKGVDRGRLFADSPLSSSDYKFFIEGGSEQGVALCIAYKPKAAYWAKQHDLSVLCLLWPELLYNVERGGSVSHAWEWRTLIVSNLCDEAWTEEWPLFQKTTLFISRGLVEEAARLSLDNKDLLFIDIYFNVYSNARTNRTKFKDVYQVHFSY